MRIIATMPGHFGDVLWAMLTIRAIAERHQQSVELYVASDFGRDDFLELLEYQDYIDKAVRLDTWQVRAPVPPEVAPVMPRVPPEPAMAAAGDLVYNLGYPDWPKQSLPYDIAARAGIEIDLSNPWITVPNIHTHSAKRLVVGWTQEWKELKYGLMSYLEFMDVLGGYGVEWLTHKGSLYVPLGAREANWVETAQKLGSAHLYLGDCSAPWVLAVAMGIPTVVMEPMEARHNPIFWVDVEDKEGRRMTRMVMGNDEKPTFDWNHVADELKAAWEEFS